MKSIALVSALVLSACGDFIVRDSNGGRCGDVAACGPGLVCVSSYYLYPSAIGIIVPTVQLQLVEQSCKRVAQQSRLDYLIKAPNGNVLTREQYLLLPPGDRYRNADGSLADMDALYLAALAALTGR